MAVKREVVSSKVMIHDFYYWDPSFPLAVKGGRIEVQGRQASILRKVMHFLLATVFA